MKVLLLKQPDNYYTILETNINDQLCKKNVQGTSYGETPDFVHLFVKTEKEFICEMKKLKSVYKKNSSIIIWVSWYKKVALRQAQGKLATDVTEDTTRNYGLQHDLVDVKVCAVSELWSGLKLVVPLSKR